MHSYIFRYRFFRVIYIFHTIFIITAKLQKKSPILDDLTDVVDHDDLKDPDGHRVIKYDNSSNQPLLLYIIYSKTSN